MSVIEGLFDTKNTGRKAFWQGRTGVFSIVASVIYLIVTVGALVWFLAVVPKDTALVMHNLGVCDRLKLLALGLFVSIGPPVWFWIEGRAFDVWVNDKYPGNRADQAALRDTYRINTDQATKFWAAVIALYAAMLLKW